MLGITKCHIESSISPGGQNMLLACHAMHIIRGAGQFKLNCVRSRIGIDMAP
jgi:hypothetical protein